jgi:hypothetical protein
MKAAERGRASGILAQASSVQPKVLSELLPMCPERIEKSGSPHWTISATGWSVRPVTTEFSRDFAAQLRLPSGLLILAGKPGRGKTHLATALAYRAIQNGFVHLDANTFEVSDKMTPRVCR